MTERIEGTTLVVGAASTIGSVVVDHLDGKTERFFLTWHEKEPHERAGQRSFQVDLTSYDSISELIEALKSETPA